MLLQIVSENKIKVPFNNDVTDKDWLENFCRINQNIHETGFSHDPQINKCVVRKGQKVHKNTQGSGTKNSSVLACISAAGQALPPLVTFSSANSSTDYIRKFADAVTVVEVNTIKFASDNGITLVKLPTTDLLQPLDRCCFGPSKQKWSNAREALPIYQSEKHKVNLLMCYAHYGMKVRVLTINFPWDPTKYPVDRLNCEKLMRYKANEADI
ncbi:hypothetical protein PR048_011200 [Dryococelus australis]|uniref:Uncharacterized protein n=1 Tax=Dryococelus australis TaxID=614101 RepID=A0ABQ9HKX1_9NEOP|nr:hypothetical protein PR048_011200 [Dryococelus australis]